MCENIEYMLPKVRGLMGIFTSNEAKNETERLLYFASLVGSGKKYDLKAKEEWQDKKYRYEGKIYGNDCTGNIVYG